MMSFREQRAARWFARMRSADAEMYRARFEKWLSDPGNAHAYKLIEEDWAMSGTVSRARIEDHASSASRDAKVFRSSSRLAWGLSLALALALGAGWIVISRGGGDRPDAAVGAFRVEELADGTIVRLSRGATLETRFSSRERRVTMAGGWARFNVAHDHRRPFRVMAGGIETEALGTIFEIQLDGSQPSVRLIEGLVAVKVPGRQQKALRLKPGQGATLDPSGPALLSTKTPPPNERTSSIIDAQRLSLGEIVARANRINARPLVLDEPGLANLSLSGRFDLKNADALSHKLAAALDLDVVDNGAQILLSRRKINMGG